MAAGAASAAPLGHGIASVLRVRLAVAGGRGLLYHWSSTGRRWHRLYIPAGRQSHILSATDAVETKKPALSVTAWLRCVLPDILWMAPRVGAKRRARQRIGGHGSQRYDLPRCRGPLIMRQRLRAGLASSAEWSREGAAPHPRRASRHRPSLYWMYPAFRGNFQSRGSAAMPDDLTGGAK